MTQDGAALRYRHYSPWRPHTKAENENGGSASSVGVEHTDQLFKIYLFIFIIIS